METDSPLQAFKKTCNNDVRFHAGRKQMLLFLGDGIRFRRERTKQKGCKISSCRCFDIAVSKLMAILITLF